MNTYSNLMKLAIQVISDLPNIFT